MLRSEFVYCIPCTFNIFSLIFEAYHSYVGYATGPIPEYGVFFTYSTSDLQSVNLVKQQLINEVSWRTERAWLNKQRFR